MRRGVRRQLRRRGVRGVLTALALLALSALPAGAQDSSDTGWTVERFDVRLTVDTDGTLSVEERIDVDFGGLEKHGIYRVIPVRYELPDDHSRYRVIDVDRIEVAATAPADLEAKRPSRVGGDRDLVLRIGSPDRTVSGKHSYTIRYRVRGALNAFDTHDELYWNVTGNGWPVPVRFARASLRGAAGAGPLTRVTCYRGPVGSPSLCDDSGVLPGEFPAWATAGDLAPGEGLTLVAGFAKGAIRVPPPLYQERWTLARAFTGSPAAWPLAGVVALLAALGVGRTLWRAGRDRAALGGLSSGGAVNVTERARPLGRITIVPEFRPPDDLRPAQLGLVLDERVDPTDVSATIVDLAVRGHLVIEERTKDGVLWFSRTAWMLRRTEKDGADLLPYERRLLDALFAGGDTVDVAELKGTFAEEYRAVCADVESDAVSRHWFRRRPSQTRAAWLAAGLAGTAAGIGLTVLLAVFTTVAVAAAPLILAGLVVTIAHRWMPARSAQGSRVLGRALGFRQYIRAAETERMEFAEAQRLFVSYLPYAVAFGAVEHWARTFSAIGVTTASLGGWYVGGHMAGGMDSGLAGMSAGLSDFSRAVGASLPMAPASSGGSGFGGGGGFSGGGFGGGGGGSW